MNLGLRSTSPILALGMVLMACGEGAARAAAGTDGNPPCPTLAEIQRVTAVIGP